MTTPCLRLSMPEFRAALLGVHRGARVTVVGLILVEDVAQRIEMTVRVAVIRDAIGVCGEPGFIVCSNGLALSSAFRSSDCAPARPSVRSFASATRRLRLAAVTRFTAPSWSSAPQRPQFFTCWNSAIEFLGVARRARRGAAAPCCCAATNATRGVMEYAIATLAVRRTTPGLSTRDARFMRRFYDRTTRRSRLVASIAPGTNDSPRAAKPRPQKREAPAFRSLEPCVHEGVWDAGVLSALSRWRASTGGCSTCIYAFPSAPPPPSQCGRAR